MKKAQFSLSLLLNFNIQTLNTYLITDFFIIQWSIKYYGFRKFFTFIIYFYHRIINIQKIAYHNNVLKLILYYAICCFIYLQFEDSSWHWLTESTMFLLKLQLSYCNEKCLECFRVEICKFHWVTLHWLYLISRLIFHFLY